MNIDQHNGNIRDGKNKTPHNFINTNLQETQALTQVAKLYSVEKVPDRIPKVLDHFEFLLQERAIE